MFEKMSFGKDVMLFLFKVLQKQRIINELKLTQINYNKNTIIFVFFLKKAKNSYTNILNNNIFSDSYLNKDAKQKDNFSVT